MCWHSSNVPKLKPYQYLRVGFFFFKSPTLQLSWRWKLNRTCTMLQEWFYTCPGIYSFIFTHESQPELGEWSLGFVKVANFYFILFFYIQYKQQIHSLSYVLTCGNTEFYLGTVLSGQSMQGQATWHPLSMNFPEFYLPRCLMHDIILSFVQSKADFFVQISLIKVGLLYHP